MKEDKLMNEGQLILLLVAYILGLITAMLILAPRSHH
jgi:hypothetical protein